MDSVRNARATRVFVAIAAGDDVLADLVGQLADPLYLRRLNALYYEFVETGMAARCGYTSPADMVDKYPAFFWSTVEPYVGDAMLCLERTIEGKQWIANLYSHVFAIEHARRRLGPQPGSDGGGNGS